MRAYGLCLAGAVATALGGCTVWTPEMRTEEAVYQTLHAVDAAQTLQLARQPARYCEVDSAWAIGSHPSSRSVIGYMAAEAVAHPIVEAWLEQHAGPWWARAWEAVTIVNTGVDVRHNIALGIRIRD